MYDITEVYMRTLRKKKKTSLNTKKCNRSITSYKIYSYKGSTEVPCEVLHIIQDIFLSYEYHTALYFVLHYNDNHTRTK